MERHVIIGLYVVLLVAVIVSVDFVFFKRELWERLIANIGIVLVFIAFYLRFIKTR
jgi:protein-S-isoprenylcysteine O-methyltransferase Ste14